MSTETSLLVFARQVFGALNTISTFNIDFQSYETAQISVDATVLGVCFSNGPDFGILQFSNATI